MVDISTSVIDNSFMNEKEMQKQSCGSLFNFYASFSYREAKRRKCHYCLAFCSVFIVVLSAIIVNTVISKGPIIFLKLAEGTTGEIDAIVTPTQVPLTSFNTYNNFDGIFLNYT